MSKTNKLTLLYIEDDEALRKQFMRVLKPKFKELYEASDGEIALKKYEQHHPDMMLVDINLPKIDGLEVIERVRKTDKHIPIVVLSAYSDQGKLLKAIKLGLSEYLIKPVSHKKLLSLFEEIALLHEKKIEERGMIALQNGYFWKKEEKILYYDDETISLTKRERMLLDFMVEHMNRIVSFDSIGNWIWENEECEDTYSALSHLIKRLRKKLPKELIENIYGEGYRVNSNE